MTPDPKPDPNPAERLDEQRAERARNASPTTFEMYVDEGDEWRWRLVHANGHTLADSSEGYASKQRVREALSNVKVYAPEADVVVDDTADERAREAERDAQEKAQERFQRLADDPDEPSDEVRYGEEAAEANGTPTPTDDRTHADDVADKQRPLDDETDTGATDE